MIYQQKQNNRNWDLLVLHKQHSLRAGYPNTSETLENLVLPKYLQRKRMFSPYSSTSSNAGRNGGHLGRSTFWQSLHPRCRKLLGTGISPQHICEKSGEAQHTFHFHSLRCKHCSWKPSLLCYSLVLPKMRRKLLVWRMIPMCKSISW